MKNFLFEALFSSRSHKAATKSSSPTTLRLEALESRELLDAASLISSAPSFPMQACLDSQLFPEETLLDSSSAELLATNASTTWIVSSTADNVSVEGTLRYAIANAENGDTITFDASLQGATITLGGTELEIAKSITIDAMNLWNEATQTPGITIDGNGQSRVFWVNGAENAGLYGLSIVNGKTTGSMGGGVLAYQVGSITASNCAITGNTSTSYGGGIALYESNGVFTNCSIDGNAASNYGGGVLLRSGTGSFLNCSISENTVGGGTGNGGGVSIQGGGDGTFVNCVISKNSASVNGGGVDIIEPDSNGAAVGSFVNCAITENTAYGYSAAYIESHDTATGVFKNCTISGNSSTVGYVLSVEGNGAFYNSIIAQNIGDGVNAHGNVECCNSLSDFSNWSNFDASGGVNYLYDSNQPLFTDSDNGDYTLAPNSQAINKGDNRFVVGATDLAGNRRAVGGTVDLGAYESPEIPSLIVTTLSDVVDPYDDEISLREAIAFYSTSGDTITFDSSLQGATITLGGTELEITKSITIDAMNLWNATAQEPGITVDGNQQSLVFSVSAENVLINGIKITNGNSQRGGGVYISGSGTLENCSICGNAAYMGGGALIDEGGNGSFANCSIDNNTAQHGGGVIAFSTGTFTNCSITNNNAQYYGGGVYVADNDGVVVGTFINCAICDNYAETSGGGALISSGSGTFINCTVSGNSTRANGCGVYINVGAKGDFFNSIIARNPLAQYENMFLWDVDARGTANGYNTLAPYVNWSNAGESGVVNYAYDQNLPLFTDSDNGDYTLAPNSQAINNGDNRFVSVESDLAGNRRVGGGIVDLGAYEWTEIPSLIVTTSSDVVDPFDGLISLREAVSIYSVAGDTITFDSSLQGATITLTDNEILVGKSLTIDATNLLDATTQAPGLTIDANRQSRIFNVEGAATVGFIGLTLTNGETSTNGGAVSVVDSSASFTACVFTNNRADGRGGAIYIDRAETEGDLFFESINCDYASNESQDHGGAICVDSMPASIQGGAFLGNTSGTEGGGIRGNFSDISIANATFTGNVAGNHGGAVRMEQGSATITDSTFADNSCGEFGGAVQGYRAPMTISGSTFSGNSAANGGAIQFFANESFELTSSFFSNNASMDGNGGALYLDVVAAGSSVLTDVEFEDNEASGYGGAIFTAIGPETFDACVFTNNSAVEGGAVYTSWGSVEISNSTFAQNESQGYGGAARFNGSSVIISDTTFTDNVSGSQGGAFKTDECPIVAVTSCEFSGNSGVDNGGAVQIWFSPEVVISDTTFTGNESSAQGGALYVAVGDNETAALSDVKAFNNTSGSHGGAICFDNMSLASIVVEDVELDGNSALDGYGGGMNISEGQAELTRVVASNNSTTLDGGAISIWRCSTTASDCVFTNNRGAEGGAVYTRDGSIEISDSLFSGNASQGNGGGARFLETTFTIINTSFSGNASVLEGGAFKTDGGGDSVVTSCVFSENDASAIGGAIQLWGSVSVEMDDVEFVDNSSANNGGAVYVGGGANVSVSRGSFTNNSANGHGGAVYVGDGTNVSVSHSSFMNNSANGYGGAIENEGGVLDVVHSLVANNTADYGGGIDVNSTESVTSLTNVTIAGNRATTRGGGIDNKAEFVIKNSIVAENYANQTPVDVGGALAPRAYNTLSRGVTWTSPSESNYEYDPGLPLFADPANDDYALIPGSQAYNKGDNSFVTASTDLADAPRIANGIVDLGAYELQISAEFETPSTFVTTSSDVVDPYDGFVSLREAISIYSVAGDTITFDSSLQGATITLNGNEIPIKKSLTIDATNLFDATTQTPGLTIDANRQSRVFNVEGASAIGFIGLAFTNGDSTTNGGVSSNGGAIRIIDGSATVDACVFTNSFGGEGGALYTRGGSVEISNSIFASNESQGHGGAARFNETNFAISNASFSDNVSAREGGAIKTDGGARSVVDSCDFTGNIAAALGGAIQIWDSASIEMVDVEFADNSSGDHGGALYAALSDNATATFSNVKAIGNSTDAMGGAFYFSNAALAKVVLEDVEFDGNEADSYGGAVYTTNGQMEMTRVVATNNVAANWDGGALMLCGTNRIVDGVFSGNKGLSGGAIRIDGDLEIVSSVFSDNSADDNGGAVYHVPVDGTLKVESSSFIGNTCLIFQYGSGGAIESNGKVEIADSLFVGNEVEQRGGAFWFGGEFSIVNSTVAYNKANEGGGVFHEGVAFTAINSIIALNESEVAGQNPDFTIHFDHIETATAYGYNTLSSFADWTNATDEGVVNYAYNSNLPLFSDADNGDFTLARNSQGVDKGDNSYVTVETDLAGSPRIMRGVVDLGAYEFTGLEAPSFAVSSTTTSITLSWSPVANAVGYVVEFDGTTYSFAATETSHTFAGLTPSTSYAIVARTLGDGVERGDSEDVFLNVETDPLQELPSPTIAGTSTTSSVTLTWNPVANASGYEIEFDGTTYAFAATETRHTFADLTPSTSYAIVARALGDGETYCDSEDAFLMIKTASLPQLNRPALSVDATTSDSIDVSWDAIPHAVSYTLSYAVKASSPIYTEIELDADETSYTISELNSYTNYYVKVRANGDNVEYCDSSQSPTVTVRTAAAVLAVPEISGTSVTASTITLTWTPIADASGYAIVCDDRTVTVDASATSGTIDNLSSGELYTAQVKALGNGVATLDSELSEPVSVRTTGLVQLARPTVTATAFDGDTIDASWSAIPYASSYTLSYAVKSSSPVYTEIELDAETTSYSISGLNLNTNYYVKVRANGDNVEYRNSAQSPTATVRTKTYIVLDAPEIVGTSATASTITLTWAPVVGASGYEIVCDEQTITLDASATSGTFVGLSANAAYAVQIRALGDGVATIDSELSESLNVHTTPLVQLARPVVAASALASDAIEATWAAIPHASSYTLSYAVKSSSPVYTEIELDADTTSYEITGLASNTSYYVKVRANGDDVEYRNSAQSSTVTAKTPREVVVLATPEITDAVATASTITLTWTPVADASGYAILCGDQTITVDASATSGVALGLDANRSYTARVKALGDNVATVDSELSESVSVRTTGLVQLARPTVTATAFDGDTIDASWSAIPYASSYTLSYAVKSSSPVYTEIELDADTTSYSISGLNLNTNYYVKVRANGDNVEYRNSAQSPTATVRTKTFVILDAPEITGTSATASTITLTWTPVVDASGYEIVCDDQTVAFDADATSGAVVGLSANASHSVQIRALGDGEATIDSEFSAPISVRTTSLVQLARPAVTATAASANTIDASWAAIPHASSYTLSYAVKASSPVYTEIELDADTTSYSISGLNASTNYYVKVRANGDNVEYKNSAQSPTATVKTKAATLLAPNAEPLAALVDDAASSRDELDYVVADYAVELGGGEPAEDERVERFLAFEDGALFDETDDGLFDEFVEESFGELDLRVRFAFEAEEI